MPKEDFKKEVERELTGRETEPWEIIYFKLYQSQMPVIERAIETAALMLGSDRSRGYCLDMTESEMACGETQRLVGEHVTGPGTCAAWEHDGIDVVAFVDGSLGANERGVGRSAIRVVSRPSCSLRCRRNHAWPGEP